MQLNYFNYMLSIKDSLKIMTRSKTERVREREREEEEEEKEDEEHEYLLILERGIHMVEPSMR